MKVNINFYDEQIPLEFPKEYPFFKNAIADMFLMDPTDVDELQVYYFDEENDKISIANSTDYDQAVNFFSQGKCQNIFLEVSEKSRLFQREMVTSKVESQRAEDLKREIMEKERLLKELLEKEEAERKRKEEEAAERKRKEEEEAAERKRKEEEEAAERKRKEEEEAAERKRKDEEEAAERKRKEEIENISPEFTSALSKVIQDNMESAKEEILQKTLMEANKMFDKIKKSNITSDTVHERYTCDGCKVCPIIGNRFKCTVCDNFDYCESCEEKYAEVHKHPFLKIRKPEQAPVKILCAIDERIPEFDRTYHDKKETVSMSIEEPEVKPEEVKPEENFFDKVKNKISEGAKNMGDMIKKGVEYINPSIEQYRCQIPLARANYELSGISDEQLLEALAIAEGDIDMAVCLLFSP